MTSIIYNFEQYCRGERVRPTYLNLFPIPSLRAGTFSLWRKDAVAWISAPILLQQLWLLLLRSHIIPSLRAVGLSARPVAHREAIQDVSFFYIQSGLLRASVQALLTNLPLAMTGSVVSFHKEANLYSSTICHPCNNALRAELRSGVAAQSNPEQL